MRLLKPSGLELVQMKTDRPLCPNTSMQFKRQSVVDGFSNQHTYRLVEYCKSTVPLIVLVASALSSV